ncbi:hypothetical protein LCGC14_2951310 [marine sediment metagenome]|uniref:Uncharacterized protein n=1 Tax=marine sediment metagenome TaxID=412755 RepID=A0A0F8Y2C4_9ZZZZ
MAPAEGIRVRLSVSGYLDERPLSRNDNMKSPCIEITWDEIVDTEQGRVFIGHCDMGGETDAQAEARREYISLGNQYLESHRRWKKMFKRLRDQRDEARDALETETWLWLSSEALEGTW